MAIIFGHFVAHVGQLSVQEGERKRERGGGGRQRNLSVWQTVIDTLIQFDCDCDYDRLQPHLVLAIAICVSFSLSLMASQGCSQLAWPLKALPVWGSWLRAMKLLGIGYVREMSSLRRYCQERGKPIASRGSCITSQGEGDGRQSIKFSSCSQICVKLRIKRKLRIGTRLY